MLKNNRSHYEILGLQPDATMEEIRESYRRLAKKFHPDLNGNDPRAEERFKRIGEAYRVLTDPALRIEYHYREEVRVKAKTAEKGRKTSKFSDLFRNAFRSGFGATQPDDKKEIPRRGQDLQIVLEIDAIELAKGCQRKVMIRREQICPACIGSGLKRGTKPVPCSICMGIGEIPSSRNGKTVFLTCTNCKGTGSIIRERCLECGGKGRIRRKSPLIIDIPPGTHPNAILTIRGQGDAGIGGSPAGDLMVKIAAVENAYFETRHFDLIYDYSVNLKQIITGGEIEVPTPDGKVKLTLQPGLQPGKMLRVKGKGLVRPNGTYGDLLVRIRYHIPERVSSRAEQLLDELVSLRGWTPKRDRNGFHRKSDKQ